MVLHFANFKIIAVGLVCIAGGAVLGELIDHTMHGRLSWFINHEPVQVGLTIPTTLGFMYFFWRQIVLALAEAKRPLQEREKAGVTHNFFGIAFKTTPFVRAAVYIGFYALGIALNFIS